MTAPDVAWFSFMATAFLVAWGSAGWPSRSNLSLDASSSNDAHASDVRRSSGFFEALPAIADAAVAAPRTSSAIARPSSAKNVSTCARVSFRRRPGNADRSRGHQTGRDDVAAATWIAFVATSRGDAADVEIPRKRASATPRRGSFVETSRGDAAT